MVSETNNYALYFVTCLMHILIYNAGYEINAHYEADF